MTKLARPRVLCRGKIFLCRDKVGQDKEEIFPNRVGQGKENFCRDKGFLGNDRAGQDKKEALHA